METIQQLLNHIRWDEKFGLGDFEVGIYDRIEDAVEFQPFESLQMEKGNHFSFTVDIDGEVLTIPYHRITVSPYHRIREVRKNGVAIWNR
jgi:uncharacterized protein (UPF0248 family)